MNNWIVHVVDHRHGEASLTTKLNGTHVLWFPEDGRTDMEVYNYILAEAAQAHQDGEDRYIVTGSDHVILATRVAVKRGELDPRSTAFTAVTWKGFIHVDSDGSLSEYPDNLYDNTPFMDLL